MKKLDSQGWFEVQEVLCCERRCWIRFGKSGKLCLKVQVDVEIFRQVGCGLFGLGNVGKFWEVSRESWSRKIWSVRLKSQNC